MTDIPSRLARRPLDPRGFVIPYSQFIDADGKPNFRIMDDGRVRECLRRRLCSLCGEPMGRHIFFIGGPLCVANGMFHDPAMHKECAEYALQACPHLARSKGRYGPVPDSIPGGARLIVGVMGSDQKAERFAIMHTSDYSATRTADGMPLIIAKRPWLDVAYWRDGQPIGESP
jgi:hypothetical protein